MQDLRNHASKITDCFVKAVEANRGGDRLAFETAKVEMYNAAIGYQKVYNQLNPIHKATLPNGKDLITTVFKEAKRIKF